MIENHFAFSLSQKWRKKYGKISDEKPMTSAMMCCGDHNSLFGLSLVSVQIQNSAKVSVKDWSKKWTDPISVVGQNPATSCDDWWLAMAAGSMHSRKRKWIQLHWTIQLSWVQFSFPLCIYNHRWRETTSCQLSPGYVIIVKLAVSDREDDVPVTGPMGKLPQSTLIELVSMTGNGSWGSLVDDWASVVDGCEPNCYNKIQTNHQLAPSPSY